MLIKRYKIHVEVNNLSLRKVKFYFRFEMFYYRPRMYLFTYAYDSDDTRELYGEYHLGRQALRFVLLVLTIPYSKEVTWKVFLINNVIYVICISVKYSHMQTTRRGWA